jgi:dihydroneopterin aldolase
MNKIQVNGIRSYAFHGCLEQETKIGGNYITNIEVVYNFENAAINDDLSKTVDYVNIKEIVELEMSKSAKLIETIAYRIITSIKTQFPKVEKCKVEIQKINPPIDGDVNYVAVIVEE